MLVFCLLGEGVGELITLAMMHYYQSINNHNKLFIIRSQINAGLGTLTIELMKGFLTIFTNLKD